jgi:hypothetical protein
MLLDQEWNRLQLDEPVLAREPKYNDRTMYNTKQSEITGKDPEIDNYTSISLKCATQISSTTQDFQHLQIVTLSDLACTSISFHIHSPPLSVDLVIPEDVESIHNATVYL